MTTHLATVMGVDITTSEFALAVRDDAGIEGYASTRMRGGTYWRDDPAFPGFDLSHVPVMFAELLAQLEKQGWQFARPTSTTPALSVSCRQHDMVVLDAGNQLLLPALSWQCNAAGAEVNWLRQLGVEDEVGPLAERFVLPKLKCVLNRDSSLAARVRTVFMTGDWLAWALTGQRTMSASDALSNGLLTQANREQPANVFASAGLDSAWFPNRAKSGEVVGTVTPVDAGNPGPWDAVKERLHGWSFVAGLGDNHASAVGCGMTDDYRTLVVSAGTSGTINLAVPRDRAAGLRTGALRFEFYEQGTLLLAMLADCAAWYNRFMAHFAPDYTQDHEQLNALALSSDWGAIRRVLHDDRQHREEFPGYWSQMSLAQKVASTQFSIMLELLLRVREMIAGLPEMSVQSFVLTGGISQSEFFQQVFHEGVRILSPGSKVQVSARTGPLRYKTSAYGAMVNAELPKHGGSLSALHAVPGQFPLRDCAATRPTERMHVNYLLRSYGLM